MHETERERREKREEKRGKKERTRHGAEAGSPSSRPVPKGKQLAAVGRSERQSKEAGALPFQLCDRAGSREGLEDEPCPRAHNFLLQYWKGDCPPI